MTFEQKELARHALGLPNKKRTSYRNHFVTGPGTEDYEPWMQMVMDGNANHRNATQMGWVTGNMDLFWLTRRGAELALGPNEDLDPEDFPQAKGAA